MSAPAAESPEISFGQAVLPLLKQRCAICHQGPSAQRGLRVTSVADLLRGGEGGPAVVAGKPESSLLISKISDEKPAMPMGGEPLAAAEVAMIRDWIAAGAKDDVGDSQDAPETKLWSLLPLRQSEPPQVAGDWARGPIDQFVLAKLTEKGLQPSAEADRRTLIRRLSYDLCGLPPTPEEMEAFAADPDPKAYEKLVDRLLASPAYGEKWGRHWLDVVRFGESHGYEQNHLRESAWPYRDWVIRSLNEDKPFNRMILEQLAGDQLAPDDPEVNAATGFLVAGPYDTVKIENLEGEAQKRANHLDDMITATASAFLGLTVHCARCHDHKFDPIQTKDYYRMQSIFAGVWHDERVWAKPDEIEAYESAAAPLRQAVKDSSAGLERLRSGAAPRLKSQKDAILARYRPSVDPAGTEESFEPVEARFVRLTIDRMAYNRKHVDVDEIEVWTTGARNAARGATVTVGSTRVDEASPFTYAAENLVDGKFDRSWISAGGLPEWIMIELPRPEKIARVLWSCDRLMGFGGRFAKPIPEDYRIEISTDGNSWKTVATSKGRLPFSEQDRERLLLFAVFSEQEKQAWLKFENRKQSAQEQLDGLKKPARAFLGRFEQPAEPSFVMVRGNPMDKGDKVVPRSLSTLDDLLPGFELAADAPEAERRLRLARWIASDKNALTARVIVNRTWMYHFGQPLVRTPSDFGFNAGEPTHPELLDWLAAGLVNKHGWRLKPLHKEIVMSAAYRQSSQYREDAAKVDNDAAFLWRFPPRRLSAEEVRDTILFISGKLDRTMGGPGFRLYRYTVDNVATYYPLEEFGPETFRRSIYHQHARSVKPELLGQFDCPDTALPSPKRVSTTTPLQALSLLNNSFLLDQSQFLADRIAREAGKDPAAQINRLWQLALGRAPDAEESGRALQFLSENGLMLLCRSIFNTNEVMYVF